MRMTTVMLLRAGAVAVAFLPISAALANPPNWLGWSGGQAPAQQTAPASSESAQTAPLQPAIPQPLGASEGAASVAPASGQAVVMQNLLDSVSRLQQQVRDLRGQVEEQGNEIKQLKKSQQAGFASFDDRITQLSQGTSGQGTSGQGTSGGAAVSAGGATAASAAPPAGPSAPVSVPTAAPAAVASQSTAVPVAAPSAATPVVNSAAANQQQNLYNAAFNLLKEGRYDQAIAGFQATVNADPQGQWSPSALFWQGETYYVQQKRSDALKAYQQVLTQFPKSDRVPDALLKTGYIAYDENKNTQARAIFQKVIDQFPQSQAANLAKQRLARMATEKR